MKFRFIWVGKTKDKNYRALQDEYLRRLEHFIKCDVVEIRDSVSHKTSEIEGKRILEKVNQNAFVCLLDVKGRGLSSTELAGEIEKWQFAFDKFFKENYPNLQVTGNPGVDWNSYWTTLPAQLTSGTPIEMIWMHDSRVKTFASKGWLKPLDDVFVAATAPSSMSRGGFTRCAKLPRLAARPGGHLDRPPVSRVETLG